MRLIAFLGKPKVLEFIHGGFVIFWIIIWVAAAIFGWLSSVIFVSHLSAAALVLSSWAAWQGARAEVAAAQEDEQLDTQ